MVLAGWFYIIRRHITVETPLDKRNLERRDRIFVRTTRVKNHPNRQPRRGLFFFFSSLFCCVWSTRILLLILALLLFLVFAEWLAKRVEGKIVPEAKKKKKEEENGRKNRLSRRWIFRSVIEGQLASAKLISKARRWDPTQQKPLHVSPSPPPAHLRLTVHNGGANYPYLRTFMPTPYLATPDCFVLANN